MNTDLLKKIAYGAAMTGLVLLLAGMLWGQGMNSPQQGPYPQAQRPPGMNSDMSNQPSIPNVMSDEDFIKDAAQGALTQVRLGQLAEDKGSSDAVKSFGKRMVEDHSKANDQLKEIASHENWKLPTELNKKNQRTYDRLSQLSGDAFDRAYARDMVRDHQSDVAAFKQEASDGQNSVVKNFASQTLPTLEDHLKMAREMAETAGKPSAGQ